MQKSGTATLELRSEVAGEAVIEEFGVGLAVAHVVVGEGDLGFGGFD